MLKKLLLILLVISLAFFGYKFAKKLQRYLQRAGQIEQRTDKVNAYLNLQTAVNFAKEELFEEILTNLPTDTSAQFAIKRKLCDLNINYGIDKVQLAKAYLCIAELDAQDKDYFSAIKNASYSVEILKNEQNINFLANLLIEGDTEKLKILKNSISEDINSEIRLLELLANSKTPNIAAKANYRLSLMLTPRPENINNLQNIAQAISHQKLAISHGDIKQTKKTDLAFVFNEKYSIYALNTIISILLNSDLDNRYNFYAIYEESDPLSDDIKNKIRSLSKIRDFDISFIPFPKTLIEKHKEIFDLFQKDGTGYPVIVFLKSFLDQVLPPKLDKILAMDVDILVFRDLNNLLNIELGDYSFAASKFNGSFSEGNLYRSDSCFGLASGEYFNSGVFLQNLTLTREEDLMSKINEKTYKCNFIFGDQDVTNIAANGKTKFISTRWNTISVDENLHNIPTGIAPFIIHYIGLNRYIDRFEKELKNGRIFPPHIQIYYEYLNFTRNFLETN